MTGTFLWHAISRQTPSGQERVAARVVGGDTGVLVTSSRCPRQTTPRPGPRVRERQGKDGETRLFLILQARMTTCGGGLCGRPVICHRIAPGM